ncbi:MAG: FHA domain-containing protein [Pyrinomonadaceae bacterium]
MKIVLAEKRAGGQSPDLTFQQEVVGIGRDQQTCQIVFDRQNYPMVSRRHAELRWQNGECFLIDNKSSYGTFVNGQQISAPHPVAVGNSLQYGMQGPVLLVVFLDSGAPVQTPQIKYPPQINTPMPQDFPNPVSAPLPPLRQHDPNHGGQPQLTVPQTPLEEAGLEYVNAGNLPAFKIQKDQIWLGRDPAGDIVFESSAVMVSRRHAEITRQNGNYNLNDNKSFNGTLVNG